MRVVWLDDALVAADAARLSIDDPGVRWGEGLFETMRADGGRVALCDRHLDRLEGSARALGWGPMPERRRMEAAVAAVAEALAPGSGRVRLTATARPTLVVEGTPEPPLGREPAAVRAVAVRGRGCRRRRA
jgi:branched-chain amino acid aminotransferase